MRNHRRNRVFADTFKVTGMPKQGPQPQRLDAMDMAIVEALQVDGRISISTLGRRIGLSQPATSERVKRLEESGVITGYGARIDPAAVGLAMVAVIRLRTTHEHIQACLKQFAKMPHISEVLRITGEDCFFLKVFVPTPTAQADRARTDEARLNL